MVGGITKSAVTIQDPQNALRYEIEKAYHLAVIGTTGADLGRCADRHPRRLQIDSSRP